MIIAPLKKKVKQLGEGYPLIKNKFSKQNKSFIGYKSISVLEQRQQQSMTSGEYEENNSLIYNTQSAGKGILNNKDNGRFRQ